MLQLAGINPALAEFRVLHSIQVQPKDRLNSRVSVGGCGRV